MSEINYRQLNQDDAKAYQTIRLEMLQNAPEVFGESYEEAKLKTIDFYKMRLDEAPVSGAFYDSNLIGTAGYFVQNGHKNKHKAFLWGVYVTPLHRGKNISFKVSEFVIQNLPENIEMIQTCVVSNNMPAVKTYKKLGFEQWGLEERALKMHNEYYDEIHMVKFLDNSSCLSGRKIK